MSKVDWTTKVVELEENEQFIIVNPKVFKTVLRENFVLPLFEDEDGDRVYGYGYWDNKLFSRMVNLYDLFLTGGTEYKMYKPMDVRHGQAVAWKRNDALDDDYFNFHIVKHEEIPRAGHNSVFYFPLTWIER